MCQKPWQMGATEQVARYAPEQHLARSAAIVGAADQDSAAVGLGEAGPGVTRGLEGQPHV